MLFVDWTLCHNYVQTIWFQVEWFLYWTQLGSLMKDYHHIKMALRAREMGQPLKAKANNQNVSALILPLTMEKR